MFLPLSYTKGQERSNGVFDFLIKQGRYHAVLAVEEDFPFIKQPQEYVDSEENWVKEIEITIHDQEN